MLRHAPGDVGTRVLARVTGDHGGGWRVPDAARTRVDTAYVLFAVGLLADGAPAAAAALAARSWRLTRGVPPYGGAMSTDWPWADEFEPEGTYLNSATMGLPPRATLAALAVALEQWRRGTAHAPGYDAVIAAAREAFARLVHVPAPRWPSAARCRRSSRWWRPPCPTGRRCSCPRGSSRA